MRNDEMRIAIVGAGIAGLTAAAALTRAGVRCEVFEQARQLAEVGAGIQIAPNAARVLNRLGLGRHLDLVGVRPAAIEMRRWDDDSVLRRTELGDRCEEMFGVPYYAVHRADLHRGLLQILPSGTVHLGLRLVGIEERPDEVELRFDDGSRLPFDVVIGADGIHSVVREVLAGDEPRFSGQSIYRGLVPAERVPFLLTEPKVTLWLGPNRHCVCYPVSGGRQVSFGATTPVDDPRPESWSAQGSVDELRAAYAGWNDRVGQLLAAADAVSQWALHDRDTVDRWSTRRVTIIGDAAHPMLPFLAQGANQAIEDAMVLAVFLRGATGPDDVAGALARYEEVRRARTEEVHGISRRNTSMLHLPDGDEQRKRDEILAATADLSSQQWLFGYDAEVEARAA
jgi:salicylate hydroxylase